MLNDVDIEMREADQIGDIVAAGLCPVCGEPLDARNPRWAGQFDTRKVLRDGVVVSEPWSAEQEADRAGPVVDWAGRHAACMP